jgi:hypothetical protein
MPVLWDMKPSTENTTKPAKILVPQFTVGTKIESLEKVKLEIIIFLFDKCYQI